MTKVCWTLRKRSAGQMRASFFVDRPENRRFHHRRRDLRYLERKSGLWRVLRYWGYAGGRETAAYLVRHKDLERGLMEIMANPQRPHQGLNV